MPLIQRLIQAGDMLFAGSMSINEFRSNLGEFAEHISAIFGIKPTVIQGIAGILNGDFKAAIEMAKPIAKINHRILDKTEELLKLVF